MGTRTERRKAYLSSIRMKAWLLEHYGSLRRAARAVKMSEANLGQYVAGVRKPGYTILARLCDNGCDINWLLTGRESIQKETLKKRIKELEKATKIVKSHSR